MDPRSPFPIVYHFETFSLTLQVHSALSQALALQRPFPCALTCPDHGCRSWKRTCLFFRRLSDWMFGYVWILRSEKPLEEWTPHEMNSKSMYNKLITANMILEGTYVKILVLNVFCCFFCGIPMIPIISCRAQMPRAPQICRFIPLLKHGFPLWCLM